MELSEKKIKILMTVMVSIIVLMVIVFVVKDAIDSSANDETTNEEMSKEELDEINRNYDKKKGILVQIDSDFTYVIRDYKDGKEYVLSSEYNVDIRNEYGKTIEVEELQIGDLVEVGYKENHKNLKYIYLEDEATRYNELENYTIGKDNKYIKVDSTKYRLSENTYIYSAGEIITRFELDERDTLDVNIIGKEIVSINVIKGHGYINLINFKDYIGETLLINDEDAYDIQNEMRLAVDEGENVIVIKTKKFKGSQVVNIKRGENLNVDVSKIKFEKKKEGYVTFEIKPSSARLYINGKLRTDKVNILLDYGNYNYNVELAGYESAVGAFRINEVTQIIKIDLVEKATEAPTATAKSSSENEKDKETDADKDIEKDNSNKDDEKEDKEEEDEDDDKGKSDKDTDKESDADKEDGTDEKSSDKNKATATATAAPKKATSNKVTDEFIAEFMEKVYDLTGKL